MKYTDSHEWVEVVNGLATVGVTEHAQQELGDIVYVELPKVGKEIKAGEEVAVLESTKAAADVYSPLSGSIVEVNDELKTSPDLVNTSPEKRGWIYRLKTSNLDELMSLMTREEYLKGT